MPRVTLHSPEISCEGCINAIRVELTDLEGVRFVQGDPKKKEVVVEFDAPATLDKIKAAMEEIGYPVDRVAA
ncbi:MAG: COP-associated protein [Candidatus Poribacteria bacterium]|nr:MAG: COP-associated protein [Candidatus Poribacteria bacterium]